MSKKERMIVRIIIIILLSVILTVLCQITTDLVVIQTKIGKIISSVVFFLIFYFATADFVFVLDKSEGTCYDKYHKVSCKRYIYLSATFFVFNIIICRIIANNYSFLEVHVMVFLILFIETIRCWKEVEKTY